MSDSYTLWVDNAPCGPVTRAQISELLLDNQITPETLCSVDDGESWQPVADIMQSARPLEAPRLSVGAPAPASAPASAPVPGQSTGAPVAHKPAVAAAPAEAEAAAPSTLMKLPGKLPPAFRAGEAIPPLAPPPAAAPAPAFLPPSHRAADAEAPKAEEKPKTMAPVPIAPVYRPAQPAARTEIPASSGSFAAKAVTFVLVMVLAFGVTLVSVGGVHLPGITPGSGNSAPAAASAEPKTPAEPAPVAAPAPAKARRVAAGGSTVKVVGTRALHEGLVLEYKQNELWIGAYSNPDKAVASHLLSIKMDPDAVAAAMDTAIEWRGEVARNRPDSYEKPIPDGRIGSWPMKFLWSRPHSKVSVTLCTFELPGNRFESFKALLDAVPVLQEAHELAKADSAAAP
ncbi:hypothetical protein DB346_00605 [Verrucomicrobia bacterium LW23]|nr:hypothetical protein DB346_00605 [Verrucomicrobia bacterium LW23]